MPNWCENDLIVTGPAKDLDRFVIQGLSFNKGIPYPSHFEALDVITRVWEAAHPDGSDEYKQPFNERPKDGYNQGGYEWCIENWGCKWDVDKAEANITRTSPARLQASFSTPWSPPLPVLRAWSSQYRTLTFSIRYYECGMAFKGRYKVRNSQILANTTASYTGHRGG